MTGNPIKPGRVFPRGFPASQSWNWLMQRSNLWKAVTPAPHPCLVFSEVSPQLTISSGIPKVCKALQRNAINDD
jgi:hypothetical protein